MANIKQQIKRNITSNKNKLQNAAFKSGVKTAIKAVEAQVANKNVEEANVALVNACKKLDKGLAKGIYHKNFVARNKSRLCTLVNTIK